MNGKHPLQTRLLRHVRELPQDIFEAVNLVDVARPMKSQQTRRQFPCLRYLSSSSTQVMDPHLVVDVIERITNDSNLARNALGPGIDRPQLRHCQEKT